MNPQFSDRVDSSSNFGAVASICSVTRRVFIEIAYAIFDIVILF